MAILTKITDIYAEKDDYDIGFRENCLFLPKNRRNELSYYR
jgi:hypothetical protein